MAWSGTTTISIPQRVAGAHLEKLQVPVIDLLRPFRERGATQALYLPRNTHWNAAGARLAGERLFDALLPALDVALGKAE